MSPRCPVNSSPTRDPSAAPDRVAQATPRATLRRPAVVLPKGSIDRRCSFWTAIPSAITRCRPGWVGIPLAARGQAGGGTLGSYEGFDEMPHLEDFRCRGVMPTPGAAEDPDPRRQARRHDRRGGGVVEQLVPEEEEGVHRIRRRALW